MTAIAIIAAAWFLLRQPGAQSAGATASVAYAAPSAPLQQSISTMLASPDEGQSVGSPLGGQLEGTGLNAGVGLAVGAGQAAVTGSSIAAALGTGLETAGIGAAAFFAAEGISDLFKCGTIGQRGCQKRSDANTQIAGIEAMRRAMYTVETGQTDSGTAAKQIAAIAQQVQAAYENKHSGDSFGIDVDGQLSGIPEASLSGNYLLGMTDSLSGMTAKFIAFLPVLQAKAAGEPYVLPSPFSANAGHGPAPAYGAPIQPTGGGGAAAPQQGRREVA